MTDRRRRVVLTTVPAQFAGPLDVDSIEDALDAVFKSTVQGFQPLRTGKHAITLSSFSLVAQGTQEHPTSQLQNPQLLQVSGSAFTAPAFYADFSRTRPMPTEASSERLACADPFVEALQQGIERKGLKGQACVLINMVPPLLDT